MKNWKVLYQNAQNEGNGDNTNSPVKSNKKSSIAPSPTPSQDSTTTTTTTAAAPSVTTSLQDSTEVDEKPSADNNNNSSENSTPRSSFLDTLELDSIPQDRKNV